MGRSNRLGGWLSVPTAYLLLAIAAAAGIHLALAPRPSDGRLEGFLAYGRISVAISVDDVNTPQTRRCIARSVQAGIDVRQGAPVIISLDGRAVGGGDLSTGELIREMTRRGNTGSSRAYCQYTFSAPVTSPGEGRYTVDIGDAKIAFTRDDLRNGVDLSLS
jgi:hypothetical protein